MNAVFYEAFSEGSSPEPGGKMLVEPKKSLCLKKSSCVEIGGLCIPRGASMPKLLDNVMKRLDYSTIQVLLHYRPSRK
jgi:hypothetical protein